MEKNLIELNDIQADRICEIVDIRFNHYEKAQYSDPRYNDSDPQYYFYPKNGASSAFKVNRVTGEFRLDELEEKVIESIEEIGLMLSEFEDVEQDRMDEIKKKMEVVNKHKKLKSDVLEYLISEKLIKE